MRRRLARHWDAVRLWRLAAWSAVVALVQCGFNTPEELQKGREALHRWRQQEKGSRLPQSRVFQGFSPFIGVYPFVVYMQFRENEGVWQCTGSIVAREWVLSARHCAGEQVWEGVVFAGDVDYTTDKVFTKYNIQIRIIRAARSYVPPTPDQKDHDIMMVRLWRGFTPVEGYVAVIPITQNKTYSPEFEETCTIIGFGRRGRNLSPDTGLQRGASFLMEPGGECGYSGITDNGLCTFDVRTKSACSGDSGGPILCRGERVQFGLVVAAKYRNCSLKFCGAPVVFNVHLFLGYYRDWITGLINPSGTACRPASQPATAAEASMLSLPSGLVLCMLSSSLNPHLTT